jgi:hypothetical protein
LGRSKNPPFFPKILFYRTSAAPYDARYMEINPLLEKIFIALAVIAAALLLLSGI